MSTRDDIVAGAQHYLGTLYEWGGTGADGRVDCSGLVEAAYRAAGKPFAGRPVASQLGKMGTGVSLADALPGDVVYFDEPGATDHVGIYIGAGKMIDAPDVGQQVRVDSVGKFTSIRRVLDASNNAVSNAGSAATGSVQNVGASITDPLGLGSIFTALGGGAVPSVSSALSRIGTWLIDGLLILLGAALVIVALVLVAKDTDGGNSTTVQLVPGGSPRSSAAPRGRGMRAAAEHDAAEGAEVAA